MKRMIREWLGLDELSKINQSLKRQNEVLVRILKAISPSTEVIISAGIGEDRKIISRETLGKLHNPGETANYAKDLLVKDLIQDYGKRHPEAMK